MVFNDRRKWHSFICLTTSRPGSGLSGPRTRRARIARSCVENSVFRVEKLAVKPFRGLEVIRSMCDAVIEVLLFR